MSYAWASMSMNISIYVCYIGICLNMLAIYIQYYRAF